MIIFPSVDVEGVHGDRPYEQMILGELGSNRSWGAPRLAEVFRRYGIRATFFVDVYESSLWGADAMQRICTLLADLDQDVQLHTHPGWRDDPRDARWLREHKRANSYLSRELDFMAKLSFRQQADILAEGIELMQRWLGQRPVAHRSGGYSINTDTIRALAEVGIEIDSSMNAAHPNSRLTWSTNRVVYRDRVLELPVTVANFAAGSPREGTAPSFGRLLKTDIDACSASDLDAFVRRGAAEGLRFMNLFMHSYSLIHYQPWLRAPYSRLRPHHARLRTLERFLSKASADPNIRFVTSAEALACYREIPEALCGADSAPTLYSPATVTRHATNRLKRRVTRTWTAFSDRREAA